MPSQPVKKSKKSPHYVEKATSSYKVMSSECPPPSRIPIKKIASAVHATPHEGRLTHERAVCIYQYIVPYGMCYHHNELVS